MITTRDGVKGVDRLKSFYVHNSDIILDYVGDPALYIPEKYIISKRHTGRIGIGLIRSHIFKDYSKVSVDEEALYISIINELEKRKYDWVLFCNGMEIDYNLGKRILKRLNLSSDKLLPRPSCGQDLVDIISSFQAVFCARFHACVTAFSTGIPFVGLVWDDKIRFFAETMRVEYLFCDLNELDGFSIVNKLENAIKKPCENDVAIPYKINIYESPASP